MNRLLRKIKKNTLIDDFLAFKTKDLSTHRKIDLFRKTNDSIFTIDLKKLKFLLYEFLTFRYIFHQMHIYVFSHTIENKCQKLLIIENISLNAFF